MHKPPRRCVVLQDGRNIILTPWYAATAAAAQARLGGSFQARGKESNVSVPPGGNARFSLQLDDLRSIGIARRFIRRSSPSPIACDFGSRRLYACSPRLNKRPRAMNRLSRHTREKRLSRIKYFFNYTYRSCTQSLLLYRHFIFHLYGRYSSSSIITLLRIYNCAILLNPNNSSI